jgi:type II restriction enzyme
MLLTDAKDALDKVISKGRVHLYKPTQIAEVLYHHRLGEISDLNDLDQYRTQSRHWRDEVSNMLVGRASSSSSRYQDDVFNDNAVPPNFIAELGKVNKEGNGVVEAYIYSKFNARHGQMRAVLEYASGTSPEDFMLEHFLNMFWSSPGLRRSIDKVYEAVVYALFDSLVNALNATVTLSIEESKRYLVEEYAEFAKIVLGVTPNELECKRKASLYRVGVTNASDRGLDMWANFGPAVQVKHLTLDLDLAEDVVGEIMADRVVIVCRDCDKDTLDSIMRQIGWGSRVQGIITQSQLVKWYEKALRGSYSSETADVILKTLITELSTEFPLVDEFSNFWTSRKYDQIKLEGIWTLE